MNLTIYMKDEEYAKKLQKSLLLKYNQDSKIIYSEDEITDDSLILTDFENYIKKAKLFFSKNRENGVYIYQPLDKIYEIIKENYKKRDLLSTDIKIVSVLSVTKLDSASEIARYIAKKYMSRGKTLLVNMCFGHKYELSRNFEKGFEELLFLKDMNSQDINFEGNIASDFHYLNSCYFPPETNVDFSNQIEDVYQILKNINYKYIVLDCPLTLTASTLKIMRKSNLNILHGEDNSYFSKVINFLDNKKIKNKLIIYTDKQKYSNRGNNIFDIRKNEEINLIEEI